MTAFSVDSEAVLSATGAIRATADRLQSETAAMLGQLTQLCPGDFSAVKRQVTILATEFSLDEFLAQLEAEHRIKPEVREVRSMGFLV